MEVRFALRKLELASRSRRDAARILGSLGGRYITRLDSILAVESFEDLEAIRSLRLHPLRGARSGQWSIHLNGNFRLIVSLEEDTVVIESVEDYHGD